MVHAKNYETVSTFCWSYAEKTVASFSGHGVCWIETRLRCTATDGFCYQL